MRNLTKLVKWLLAMIFPSRCVGCSAEGKYLCRTCEKLITVAPKCSYPKEMGFDALISCLHYDPGGVFAKLLMSFKYNGIREIAEVFSPMIGAGVKKLEEVLTVNRENTVVVPVPMGKKRLRERGFNQARVLALMVGSFLRAECVEVLAKKNRAKQSTLKRQDRVMNLQKAIIFKPGVESKIAGKMVILVDDVATTLSTLNECSKVLKANGASRIICLVLARAKLIC